MHPSSVCIVDIKRQTVGTNNCTG